MSHPDLAKKAAREAGLTRYPSLSPCKYGHVGERYVRSGECVGCFQERRDRYRCEKREEYLAERRIAEKKRRDADLEKSRATSRKWREENRETFRASVRLAGRKWRLANPDKASAWGKSYRQRNQGKFRVYAAIRRARKLAAGGVFTFEQIEDLFARQRGRCANSVCRISLKAGYHVDHRMPLALGGNNWPRNLQLLCAPCNLRKNAKHPLKFAAELGLLV